jgi:hypothetical protein
LDSCFIDYLLQDQIALQQQRVYYSDNESFYSQDDELNQDELEQVSFPELEKEINIAIQEFKTVFPKLNWSSPKDAAWIAFGNSLECHSVNDIYLLLKASDFIVHDLKQNWSQYHLILRKFIQINPCLEFRCFIKQNHLVGISQRDIRSFYPILVQDTKSFQSKILSFFDEHIKDSFGLDDYVVDVYVSNRIYIIDFNPFNDTTDSLLFQWPELHMDVQHIPLLRTITSEQDAQGREPPFTMNRLPLEAFEYSCNGASIAEFIETFQSELKHAL